MLTFVIPVLHQIKHSDKVLIVNRDNLKRNLTSLQSYQDLLAAIQEDELKCGKYEISPEDPAAKTVFECLVKGVFYAKETETHPKGLVVKAAGKPKMVYLCITSQCNMQCVYCYKDAVHISQSHQVIDLDIPKVKQLIDEFADMCVTEVVFSGGEPMLANGLFEVAAYAKSLGIHTCLLTNGTLITPANVNQLACFDTVKISLDSVVASENEQTRGKGMTDRILRGMKLVKEQGLKLIAECVINKSNYDSLDNTISVLYKQIGVDGIRFTYMVPVGRGENNALALDIPYDVSQKHIVDMHFRALGERYMDVIGDSTFSICKPLVGCGAGINEIMVECDGRTYPCRMFHNDNYYMGNLFQETFQEMQQKDSFQAFRRSIMVDAIEDCKDCTVKYMCAGGCRPAHRGFTGELRTNYPQWCLMTHKNLEYLLWLQENINPITGQPMQTDNAGTE